MAKRKGTDMLPRQPPAERLGPLLEHFKAPPSSAKGLVPMIGALQHALLERRISTSEFHELLEGCKMQSRLLGSGESDGLTEEQVTELALSLKLTEDEVRAKSPSELTEALHRMQAAVFQ